MAGHWTMPYWMAIPLLILEYVLFFLVYRYGFVKGKRIGMYKWRCSECHALLLSSDEQEILHGSILHMRKHLMNCTCPPHPDVTVEMRDETGQHLAGCPRNTRRGNGTPPPPEEGRR